MRDLALEVYFSRWRSVAHHDLTSSDSETVTLAEPLGTADAEDLQQWETLRLGYTDTRGSAPLHYPRYKPAEGAEALCKRLVEECGVLLLPASIYRSEVAATPADHFRVGFGRRGFAAGLDALKTGLRRDHPRRRAVGR